MDVKEQIINECLNVLHRKEVKEEFKELMRPLIDMLIKEIYPLFFSPSSSFLLVFYYFRNIYFTFKKQ